MRGDARQPLNGLEERVDGTVPARRFLPEVTLRVAQVDGREVLHPGTCDGLEALDRPVIGHRLPGGTEKRLDVGVEDLSLLVGELLELLEEGLEGLVVELVAETLQAITEGMPSAVFA